MALMKTKQLAFLTKAKIGQEFIRKVPGLGKYTPIEALLVLKNIRMAIPKTNLFPHQALQRNAFNRILQYANKYRLPEGLKEQMLAHMQLKFKTAELQQEVLQYLPKTIRSNIARHLFQNIVETAYLFKGVCDDFIASW